MICATKVRFLGKNGTADDLQFAMKRLEVGKEYPVATIHISDFHTDLVIYTGEQYDEFNSVMFEGVEGSEI